jgi:hypothetical protein
MSIEDRTDKTHTMSKAKRLEWLMSYFSARPSHWYENTLNADFVQEYIDATNAPHTIRIMGANTCPTLARDLHTLYKQGKLERISAGTGDMHILGFPSWTWAYRLSNKDTK